MNTNFIITKKYYIGINIKQHFKFYYIRGISLKKIFVYQSDNDDNIIEIIKEKYPDEELDIYVSDNYINIDSEPNKYGTILDKISESDIAYFSKDYTKDILSQLEYQYCKDLGIEIIIE